MSTTKQREQAEAVERLREWVKPGDTIYCVLRHVSRSGMSRTIQLVKVDDDGTMLHLGWNAAKAIGWTYDQQREGVKVGGAGMDMGFHLVYTLASVLFRDEPKVKRGDRDAGYLLDCRWI